MSTWKNKDIIIDKNTNRQRQVMFLFKTLDYSGEKK